MPDNAERGDSESVVQRSRKERRGASSAEREAMFELVVKAGERALDEQRDELNGMRSRAVAFSAIILSATAFLVGGGLVAGVNRTELFYRGATIGTAALGVMLVLLILMTVPMLKFRFVVLPGKLSEWVEGERPVPSKAIFVRALATDTLPAMIAQNSKSLSAIRILYGTLLFTGFATLGIWIFFIWAVR